MTDGIFISYRRDDSLRWTGRIYHYLCAVFGKDRVFFDVDSLYPGTDWDEAIDRTVAQAAVIVLIVGPRWASIEDARGTRRLHKDDDKHAYEVATALASGKPVIPITVDGAVMPEAADLPERLQRLTRKQAFALTPAAYYYEIKVLVDLLARVVEPLGDGTAGDASEVVESASEASTAVAPGVDPEPVGEVVATEPPVATIDGGDRVDPEDPVDAGSAPPPSLAPTTRRTPASPQRSATERGLTHDVFMSYSRMDRRLAERFFDALSSNSLRVWADWLILGGAPSWGQEIATAIDESRVMLVICTSHSVKSANVEREVAYADERPQPAIRFLPVVMEEGVLTSSPLRLFFSAPQRVELWCTAESEWPSSLVSSVRNLLRMS